MLAVVHLPCPLPSDPANAQSATIPPTMRWTTRGKFGGDRAFFAHIQTRDREGMQGKGPKIKLPATVLDDEHLRPDVRQSRVDLVLERLHH